MDVNLQTTSTFIADKEAIQRVGFNLARGAVSYFGTLVLIAIFLAAIWDASGMRSRDATDSPTERSGLKPRTDYGTGCQYLETSDGAITPRLDRTGKQICR